MNTIENAKIRKTSLGNEDHGIMTAYLYLEGEGWGVGFGGYALDQYDKNLKRRVGSDYGMEFIKRILEVLEIETWEDLPGTYIRVENEGIGGRAVRIGHITKNKWFDPQELADSYKEKSA